MIPAILDEWVRYTNKHTQNLLTDLKKSILQRQPLPNNDNL
ncbi:MAG: hypothetical protein ACI8RD_007291 [Bacillariaceae sp.]|jgi:hypothetical protein